MRHPAGHARPNCTASRLPHELRSQRRALPAFRLRGTQVPRQHPRSATSSRIGKSSNAPRSGEVTTCGGRTSELLRPAESHRLWAKIANENARGGHRREHRSGDPICTSATHRVRIPLLRLKTRPRRAPNHAGSTPPKGLPLFRRALRRRRFLGPARTEGALPSVPL